MRNVKNLILCLLMLVAVSLTAGDGGGMHNDPDSPIRLLVQYDLENIAPNQGVGVPAPPSFVSDELVTASELGIVQGSGVALLNDPYRDGVVVGPGPTQQMSFQQGIPNFTVVAPELYNFFEFSMAAVHDSVGITSISFLTGHNYPGVSDCEGIIEYRASNGDLLGSDTFDIPNASGFVLAPVSIVPSTTLVVGTQTTFFRIRFNEEVYGMHSWTVQLRIDDVELSADPELMLARLRAYILEQVSISNINLDLEGGLLDKVDAASETLARGNPNSAKTAMNNMKALINQVEAQTDKKIEADAAAAIIEIANQIITALGG